MVMLNFDAHHVDPSSGKDPVPAGKYLAVINASEMKPTKNGAGQYLEFEYQILTGEHQGRRLWSRHTLQHTNLQTVEIARSELSAICRAIGVMQPTDSCELHNLPLTIIVKLMKRRDTGEVANEIVAWARKDALAGVPQQAGSPGGSSVPSWLRTG
jgi:Protein of unknown function (DUF669)